MKYLQVFENFSTVSEASTAPVIDFNKLPISVKKSLYDGTVNRNDDEKLWAAGFPKVEAKMDRSGFESPFSNINFLRYYKDIGGEYRKRTQAPFPNYIEKEIYAEGFDKCPCVMKQAWEKLLNKEGIVYAISPIGVFGAIGTEKRYKPNGVLELITKNTDGTSTIKKSTYSCDGNKVIDAWVKNPKDWKTYKDTPFIKSKTQGEDYIPWRTKDGPGQDYVKKLQQSLIDKKYLNIPKPTGNLGEMTKRAVYQLADKSFSSKDIHSEGISKSLYNGIVALKR